MPELHTDESVQAAQNEKQIRMTTTPVEPLILKLALPTILSMLVTTFYNMADTFFVGKLNNTSATGAVGVVFSLMAIIQAVGFFCGHGSGNYISRKLGSGRIEDAERMAATGFFVAFLAGGMITVAGLCALTPLAELLGATDTILPYAVDYMRIILCGAPVVCASIVLNNQLRFQGNALYAMIGLVSGAVLNIALDPIFIFACGMGVSGAALATVISQTVSMILLFVGCLKSDSIKIKPRLFTPRLAFFLEIARGGMPSLCRQGLASVATMALNHMMGLYGDAAIAAMSIVSRISMFAGSAMIGFGQGFQPVCGFNYGAERYDRVRKAFFFCVKVSTVFLAVLSAVVFLVAPQAVSLFQKNDPEVLRIGALALRIQICTMPLIGWTVMANMMLQTVGKVGRASFLAMARQGLFFIPSVLLLPLLFDLTGVLIAQSVADVISFVLAVPISLQFFSQLKKLQREQPLPSEPNGF